MGTRKRSNGAVDEKFPLEIVVGSARTKIFLRDRRQEGKGLVFRVEDYSSGARRLRDFADLGKAKAEATRIATLVSRGQVHAASLDNHDAASFGQARALLDSTGVSLEVACATIAEALKLVDGPATILEACRIYRESHAGVTEKKLSEAVAEFLGVKESQGASTRYRQDLSHRLGKLADAFQGNVDDVRTSGLQQWLDALKASAQTTRNFRVVIGTFFTFCRSRGWCSSNPAEGLTVPSVRSEEEPEIFTAAEFAKLLSSASQDFLPCLVLGGFCGLRSAEIERLHWEDVRLAEGEVVIKRGTAKTKSRRIVPICDAAKQWLAPYASKTGAIWTGTHEDFYDAQADTAKAAGISWKPNGLRHGYASHRLATTGDAVRVSHEMGNSPGVVHGHYKSLVSELAGRSWFSIFPERPSNVEAIPQAEAAA